MFDELQKKITEEMSKVEVQDIFESEKNGYLEEIKELIDKIKDGKDKEELFNDIREKCESNILAETVIEYISTRIIPYEQTQYLREMQFDEFKMIIDYMFINVIIQTESRDTIKTKVQLSSENINYIIKLLYTALDCIIVRRFTSSYFMKQFNDWFKFDEEKTKYLWQLFYSKKENLANIVLLNNITICKEIKSELNRLVKIFSDIFEDDDDDESIE